MTSDAKKLLSKAIRGLRTRLLSDLHEAMNEAYKLGLPAEKAKLTERARERRRRLEAWIDEQTRSEPKSKRTDVALRLRREVEKDAASTLLVRLTFLRLMEAAGQRPKLVTGGWESASYKDFRQLAPELVQDDPSEGFGELLALVFSDLAQELPGLFGNVRLTELVPVPPATLRALIEALNEPELESVWSDDTTLGWVYQYWNDPEREALDEKIGPQRQKLENHEIAAKTQMFTERYLVEWLLQNTVGTMWLAMCRKHGWTAEVERKLGDGASVLDQLDARRAAFRAQREAGAVSLDALMPIAEGLEQRWKYWVPQPIVPDAIARAPRRLSEFKLLDPACGSGHFLVIACDLLFALYQEEARQRGELPKDREIVESILEHNLHGIDIDPRAVQVAAAALLLKAKQLCPEAEPRHLNLVAPNLSLAGLPADDLARQGFFESVERETGLPHALSARILQALEGADYLGSLLKLDAEVESALAEWEDKLGRRKPQQTKLFEPQRDDGEPLAPVSVSEARETLLDRLEEFLGQHGAREDLGLRLKGEQLAAGVRFVRLVREGQYDLVIGNPPYQGTSKMADAAYVQKHYPRGKADLYAAFLERGLELVREGGVSALLTMRNWMFIKQFSALREWLLETYDLRLLGDVDRGAFDEVPNEVLSAVMSVFRRAKPSDAPSVAMQPTPLEDKSYDRERTKRKRAAVLCGVGRFEFGRELHGIESRPVVYWWSSGEVGRYLKTPKLGHSVPVRQGLGTRDDTRFIRRAWEAAGECVYRSLMNGTPLDDWKWVPLVKGAAGRVWFEPLTDIVSWQYKALVLRVWIELYRERSPGQYFKNADYYFQRGIAFSMIGAEFNARYHRFASVFGEKGSSAFPVEPAGLLSYLNSRTAVAIMTALNPSICFQVGDVARLPYVTLTESEAIFGTIDSAFTTHESHREPSVEFLRPGPSPWRYAQAWAQRAVDRPEGEPLPPYQPELDPEPASDHLSFAIGVALGRFGAHGEGILHHAPDSALAHGILYLSAASDADSLEHPAAKPIVDAWAAHGGDIAPKAALKDYLQDKFFGEVHRKMYENRPIYFPLSSKGKSFVAYVSIHRWSEGTLRALLAEHLYPEKQRLEGEQTDLRPAVQGSDAKARRAAENRLGQVAKWHEELSAFIQLVESCAEKGPPPASGKCTAREKDARYAPDLDDGVMINAAALWPLLAPQWKDPEKWWRELANAPGVDEKKDKKDYDWAHLSARYFPTRVDDKCQKDPSLAVAHGCFWKYHPEKAYQWELRLQDEIGPSFTLDEPAREGAQAFAKAWEQLGSDAYREAFEAAHPEKVQALVEAERKRREKKARKSGEVQGELGLEGSESAHAHGDEDEDEDEDEDVHEHADGELEAEA